MCKKKLVIYVDLFQAAVRIWTHPMGQESHSTFTLHYARVVAKYVTFQLHQIQMGRFLYSILYSDAIRNLVLYISQPEVSFSFPIFIALHLHLFCSRLNHMYNYCTAVGST